MAVGLGEAAQITRSSLDLEGRPSKSNTKISIQSAGGERGGGGGGRGGSQSLQKLCGFHKADNPAINKKKK